MTTMTAVRTTRLPGGIACDECGTTAYRIMGEAIVIEHSHKGTKHTTMVSLEVLLENLSSPIFNLLLDKVQRARGE